MQLSTRKTAAAEMIDLAQVLSEFSARFCEQNNLPDSVISIDNQPATAILFDLHHLDQILWNLCQNALDHNDNPSPLISISSYAGDNAVILEIKDNGSGIDASELDSVFEPFFTCLLYTSPSPRDS